MCGIAAIFSYHRVSGPVDPDEMCRIRDAMAIRGPDGQGVWYSANQKVGLAHRRLSIIDLSERGAQPMASADGNAVITFNGEIYNYERLRNQLEKKGHRFRSRSDTEVLLSLYHEKGVDMLADLRGMFAFAIWDERHGKLLLARDPYGIKPLYYSDDGWQIRAASQVKALLAGGKISREHEAAGLAGFYLLGAVPEPWTLYREIQALPAGHYLEVTEEGVTEPVAWCSVASIFLDGSEQGRAISQDEALDELRSALHDSVSAHLVSDVPVGLFLSSGIDSGAIAGLSRDLDEPVATVTLAFAEYAGSVKDEAPLARDIAQHYGLMHHESRLDRQEFSGHLPSILGAMDQPSVDGINTWLISRAAKMLGWKVALSGVGGDELFGGYPSFRDIPNWVRKLWIPSAIPFLGRAAFPVASGFGKVASKLGTDSSFANPKFAGMLKYGGTYAGAYLLRRGLFLPEELPAVMGRELAREGLARLRPLEHLNRTIDAAKRTGGGHFAASKVAALESSVYLRNQLLRDADWAGMAHSLEIRTPWVDITLLRRVATLARNLRNGQGKQLLAAAPSKVLPAPVRSRAKTGFTVPVDEWLQLNKDLDAWKQVPSLRDRSCPWARRWAYTVMALAGRTA